MKVQHMAIVWFLVALQVTWGYNMLFLWTNKWKFHLVILMEIEFI